MPCDTAYVRRSLDGAPPVPSPLSPDVAGVQLEDGAFACARCWGRMAARGCTAACRVTIVWDRRPVAATCVGCEMR